MTHPANSAGDGGPSLSQARTSSARHTHNHNHHNHNHLHLHRRLHTPEVDTTSPHIRSPPTEKKLHDRQVVVVETVSVVHYIDATGSVTSVETLQTEPVAPPTPINIIIPPGATDGLTTPGDALPSVSLSGLFPESTDGAPSTTATSAESETTSASSLSASSETLTSSSSSFDLTSTISASNYPTIEAGAPGGDSDVEAGAPWQSTVPVEPTPEAPSGGLPPETRDALVGGIVGSVAGIALVALAFLYLMKWRKQRVQGIMLLRDGDNAARSRGFVSPEPTSPTQGGAGAAAMAERSVPFAVPAALAKLTGGKRAIEAPPPESPTQEKGFYRVSGRKLISVLESGGDGYSDPHDSIGSQGSYFRDSEAFAGSSNLQPLQLGSPMRPVSGVPIFRDGPGRTAVEEEAPISPNHRRSAFPTTLRVPDPVGRSFASRDGSHGSASRFTEDA
ncbi:hypothetical protein N0V88_001296 [Collariella sp. IMI 366227]|nr:hypothetical protein N0V88_001296 [Collariella sp. IMI 366227]